MAAFIDEKNLLTGKPRKVCIISGTRPEVIKLAPVNAQLQKHYFEVDWVMTGQHSGMVHELLPQLNITPAVDLALMQANQTPASFMGRAIEQLDAKLKAGEYEAVLVQGDTGSTLAGAIAAYQNKIPLAHVEAGLRSYDLSAPWPEEGNRAMVSRIASFNYAPTELSAENLRKEKVPGKIFTVGNTVIDMVQAMAARLESEPELKASVKGALHEKGFVHYQGPMILVTGHRRESFGEQFASMCDGIRKLAENNPDKFIVWAVHLNPAVNNMVKQKLQDQLNVVLISTVSYAEFVYLMSNSHVIVSDSGGIQEEAPCLNKPLFVMRNKTERPEVIQAGAAKLVGTDGQNIATQVQEVMDSTQLYGQMADAINPYGDGTAAEKIALSLQKELL